ncbi:NADPH:quinone oxidoreductase family protein [Burkholderia sp. Ac-20353]|uniref:NADPH:quinone oxidoreductase family protein n=1 Tax=Burkholderia sp. Ac-20353 TaxID=2703894 RepID=UPI00197C5F03|nr:NADPH:quinone oxidoreductase family protein [Burkholderia sp. Ac-20353]MBN3785976.1 NADPH:quinone oxidoreductase family protein [Burkholderia sp. Ac-20353]
MKALLCTAFGPIDRLRLEDVAVPEPAAGQVRIRVKAAALNFPDALIVQGLYQTKPALPFSPGAELAGMVDAVGESVTAWQPGDAVIAWTGYGAFAEMCVTEADQLTTLPSGMDFDQGAALTLTYGTSLHALQQRACLQRGETLLVLGAAGGVGLAAIEIAKALGARVIAAASTADKLALCRDAGADETVDYVTDDLRRRVDELTDGRGVDVVYDPVGGLHSEAALRATAWRGRFLVIGFAAGEIPKIPLNLALLKERDILGVFWGDAVRRDPQQHVATMRLLAAWFAAGKVRPVITERVPLAGAADAIARMADRQVKGKVVIVADV